MWHEFFFLPNSIFAHKLFNFVRDYISPISIWPPTIFLFITFEQELILPWNFGTFGPKYYYAWKYQIESCIVAMVTILLSNYSRFFFNFCIFGALYQENYTWSLKNRQTNRPSSFRIWKQNFKIRLWFIYDLEFIHSYEC